jgi:hypothetical protein
LSSDCLVLYYYTCWMITIWSNLETSLQIFRRWADVQADLKHVDSNDYQIIKPMWNSHSVSDFNTPPQIWVHPRNEKLVDSNIWTLDLWICSGAPTTSASANWRLNLVSCISLANLILVILTLQFHLHKLGCHLCKYARKSACVYAIAKALEMLA